MKLSLGRLLMLTAALVFGVYLPQSTFAHARPVRSQPAADARIVTPPTVVQLTFGETPDAQQSTITVRNAAGAEVSSGAPTSVAGDLKTLQVKLQTDLPVGLYTVTWATLSIDDGETANGSFSFRIVAATDSAAPRPALPATGMQTALPRLPLIALALGSLLLGACCVWRHGQSVGRGER